MFSNALPKFAELIQPEKMYDLSAELKTIRSSRIRVKNKVQEIWGRPLTLLELLIEISREASIEFDVTPEIQKEEYFLPHFHYFMHVVVGPVLKYFSF